MLRGKRIILRPIETEDIPMVYQWCMSSDEMICFTGMHPSFSLYKIKKEYEQKLQSQSYIEFVIELENKIPIGIVTLKNINWNDKNSEIGLLIGEKQHQNKCYGIDALFTLINFAFTELGLHRLYAHIYEFNEKSVRLISRISKKEGILREGIFRGGKYYNKIMYSLLAQEFSELKESFKRFFA